VNITEYNLWGRVATAARGSQLPHARLTESDVRAIRTNVEGKTAAQWARHFGVHLRTIEKVVQFRSWRHVA